MLRCFRRNRRGQFSILAAMFVAVILISSVMLTYQSVRYSSNMEEPHILSAIDETNLALKQVLGFTVGYYGSVLQVTGNSTYARTLANRYLMSGLENVADIRPEWGSSFTVTGLEIVNNWFMNESYSKGTLNVTYSLTGLEISGIAYSASLGLNVTIFPSDSPNKVCLNVTRDEGEPINDLGKQNFEFYRYRYGNLTWEMASPTTEPVAFSNGTYLVDIPQDMPEINPYAYIMQVKDTRGITVAASSYSHYTSTLTFNSTYADDLHYVEGCMTDVDNSPNKGERFDFTAQQSGPNENYDVLTEAVTGTSTQNYYPNTYSPQGSTSLIGGSLADLQSDNNQFMTFRSYPTAFSGTSTFGYSGIGATSQSIEDYIRGSRFTAPDSSIAQSISAYLDVTTSPQNFGNTNIESAQASIENTIRGSRFSPSSSGDVSSLSVYVDVGSMTFGDTSQEASTYNLENYIRGSYFQAPESGTLQSIKAYIQCSDTAKNMKAAIYTNSGHTLVSTTEQKSVSPGTTWVTFNFPTPPSVTGGTNYVLVVWSDSANGNAYLYGGGGSSNQGHYQLIDYDDWPWPSTASFTHESREYSVYATYTPRVVKAALYSDAHSLIANTAEGLVSADGWVTLSFPSPPTVTSGTNYVLVAWSDSATGTISMRYHSASSNQGHSLSQTYGSWPSSASFSHNNYEYSIYCTIESGIRVKAALYLQDNSYVAGTEEIAVSADGWVTFDFPDPKPDLDSGTDYVLVVWGDDTSGDVRVFYSSGSSNQGHSLSRNYGSWPSDASFSHSTNKYSIYCTYLIPSEFTCEVEFSGSSNLDLWQSLLWTIDSSATTDVTTTFQLYNYTADAYPTSGDGYMTASVGIGGVTRQQNVISNPANFRDDLGRWKLELRAVLETTSQFDLKVDLAQFQSSVNHYGLDMEENWAHLNMTLYQPTICIKTGNLTAGDNLAVDFWNVTTMNWQNILPSLNPNSWNNKTVDINPPLLTIRFRSSDVNDFAPGSFQLDAVLFRSSSHQEMWQSLQDPEAVITVEVLQNGTMRWLGQGLRLMNSGGEYIQGIPIPPVPVKAIHVNQTTIWGENAEVPFQIEDWGSNYNVPLGLTNSETVFGNRQMIVSLINTTVSEFTIWWNGSDSAILTPLAYENSPFNVEFDYDHVNINNGVQTLQVLQDSFTVTSTVNGVSTTTNFMRVNDEASVYGAGSAPVIYNGTVRDVIQQEAEWNGGADGCPNLYANIVLTLPAHATYFTYHLRFMFMASDEDRNIDDLCPVEVISSIDPDFVLSRTEDGVTLGGDPVVSNTSGIFANTDFPWTPHHWSQLSDGDKGSGIMFTDANNQLLYYFDSFAGFGTGALKVSNVTRTLEVLPVSSGPVSFQSALDVTWYGAVVTFHDTYPIYMVNAGGLKTGLWIFAELPPTITVTTGN